MQALLPQTATVVSCTVGATDRYGNDTYTYATRASYPCRLRQLRADERGQGDNRQVITHRIYLPADADLGRHDRVTVEGVTYEVDGEPYRVRGSSTVHHVEADLTAVTS